MAADKKINELPVTSAVAAADVSVLIRNGIDYQYNFTNLLEFINSGINSGVAISFGTVLPQNNTGKNGDLFINTSAGSFSQKTSGIWAVKYTLPSPDSQKDGTVLYDSGIPGAGIGNNNDTYINISTGVFYKKLLNTWQQVFSMQTGPQGPKGDKGDIGLTGVNGKTLLSGTSTPSNFTTGTDGDFYLNTNTLILFGPKTAGVWGNGVPIVGIQGEQGEDGDTGQGISTGGSEGQILGKHSSDDYNTEWIDNQFSILTGQPEDNAALSASLGDKVDKVPGYDLSQENYTIAEKNKLANLSEHFKGNYTNLIALTTANLTGLIGDYAFVDGGISEATKMYIWDDNDGAWVIGSGSGVIPDATESTPGIVELATIAESLTRTDDQRAMTALKTIALILDEKKNADRQIAAIGVNEVSFLMKNSGNVLSITIAGATNAKLKIGLTGTYPLGAQSYPFAYTAGDRVFVTYNYPDLFNASCNIVLTCRDI